VIAPGSRVGAAERPDAEAWVPVDGPYDMAASLSELQRGPFDPTTRVGPRRSVQAWRARSGPVTLELTVEPGGVRARAWGPGAGAGVAAASDLVGAPAWGPVAGATVDARPTFEEFVHRLARRAPGLRLPRTGRVMDALVPAVIEQKVTGTEAWRSWRRLVRASGEAAPGPFGLRLAPAPDVLAGLPYHAFHRFGIERRRADSVRRACLVAARLAALADAPAEEAVARLGSLPGIGVWTTNEVVRRSHGWADAVSVGDYHHARQVCWAFDHDAAGTDERMLELLEPFRPRRAVVVRLVEMAGLGPPRRAPRARLRSIEEI